LVGDYEAQEAADNLIHFPPAELSALGVFYDQARFMSEWTEKEDTAWNELELLSKGGTRLGAFDVAMLRRDLQIAKNYERLTLINARRQIDRGRELGVAPGPSRTDYLAYMCESAAA
jgi:hypothetical protein